MAFCVFGMGMKGTCPHEDRWEWELIDECIYALSICLLRFPLLSLLNEIEIDGYDTIPRYNMG